MWRDLFIQGIPVKERAFEQIFVGLAGDLLLAAVSAGTVADSITPI
jgi:hypothetical protein